MMYEGFANVYDHMMNHIPYETWFENLLQYLHEKGVLNGRICELGCGTGVMTEKFAAAGYDMIGLDACDCEAEAGRERFRYFVSASEHGRNGIGRPGRCDAQCVRFRELSAS